MAQFPLVYAAARDKILSGNRMCRNIKNLFNFDPPITEEEIRAAIAPVRLE